jgi:DNA-directed RNA polymerase subunit beta'
MRPILPSNRGNELQIADINYLYRDVGLASEALRGVADLELPQSTAQARQHLHESVGALFGLNPPTSPQLQGRAAKGFVEQITGAGSPKTGFFHKKILKRQQDLSGRATATPDNTLHMDQIGIPEDMLWSTYSKFIMKGLVGQGHKPLDAAKMIEERHSLAKNVLDIELQKRPVFVNRAPSLHKHNFVAAYPVPVAGKSLRVNPFMERGQNLDYDGDTMQIHVPVTDKAVEEARQLTLSNLLFSDRSRDDLMVFPQHEAILGTYIATARVEPGAAKKFKTKAEAMEAYRKGEISMNTPIEITGKA